MNKNKVFDSITSFYYKIKNSRFLPVILVGIFFILCLILYAILVLPLGAYEGDLFVWGASSSQVAEFESQAIKFRDSLSHTGIIVTSLCLMVVVFIPCFLSLKKGTMTFKKATIYIIALGFLFRLLYAYSTDAIFLRQHDVWSSNYYGHFGITSYLYTYGSLPPLNNGSLSNSYQLYHPKLMNYTFAIFMKFMSLFVGDNIWILYQSTRILTLFFSIVSLYFIYLTLKELKCSDAVTFFATTFFAFFPMFIRLSSMTNNDGMMYMFIFIGLYFAVRWWNKSNAFNSIFLSLSIGLAMEAKLSGSLFAVVVGIMFIAKLFLTIKDKKYKELKSLVKIWCLFFVICIPIGLFWPIYNKVNYDQAFNYVWVVTNKNLLVDASRPFWQEFLIFSIPRYFSSPKLILFGTNNEWNLYSAMMKSSIFGEFNYNNETAEYFYITLTLVLFLVSFFFVTYFIIKKIIAKDYASPLLMALFVGIILEATFVLGIFTSSWIYLVLAIALLTVLLYLVRYIYIKKYYLGHSQLIFFSLVFIVFLISYLIFNVKNPYTCTMDFRYIVPCLLIFGYGIGKISERLLKTKKKKILTVSYLFVFISFCLTSFIFYLVISL